MRSVRYLALALLVASAACEQAPLAPEAGTDDVTAQFGFTNAGGKTLLGGLNVWAYCNSQGYPTVGYKRGWIEGPRYAYNNWACQTGPDQLNPTDPHPINMTAACQWQYDTKAVQAHPDDPDHAWSWKCWSSKGDARGPVEITSCDTDITAPGVYFLKADLTGCLNGIAVRSDDVTVHLGGHSILGLGPHVGRGLNVVASNNVTILGPGSIDNFFAAAEWEGVTGSRMSSVTFSGSRYGIALNADFFTNPGGPFPPSAGNEFYGNSFSGNTGSGIVMNGAENNKFRGNDANANVDFGVYFYWANGNDFKGNKVLSNGAAGIYTVAGAHDNVIQGNRALDNAWGDLLTENATQLNTWKANTFGVANQPWIN